MSDKKDIREKMLALRNSMDRDVSNFASVKIVDSFLEKFQANDLFLMYYSFGNEVKTHFLIEHLYRAGKRVFLPLLRNNVVSVGEYEGKDKLVDGSFGIKEPFVSSDILSFNIIIVPGLAFGKNLMRVGFGKGYYDRLLAGIEGKKIGFAYDFQVLDSVPFDENDIGMDYVLTEKNTYIRRN